MTLTPNEKRWNRQRADKRFPLFALSPHRGVITSVAGAQAVAPHTFWHWQVVFTDLAARGERGGRLDELVVELAMRINTVSPCVGELLKAGLVIRTVTVQPIPGCRFM